jgi:PAS domain S-box-containing protein
MSGDPKPRIEGSADSAAALLELASEPLFAVDHEGCFEVVNGAFVDLTGYDRESLLGRHGGTLLAGSAANEWDRRVSLLSSSGAGRSDRWTGRIVSNRGTEIPVEWEFSPREGSTAGALGRAQDVRADQQREQKLNILTRALRHNIRNQMNIVIGKAGSLQAAEDDSYRAIAEKIEEIAVDVVNISDKARKAQEHVGVPSDQACQTDLVDVVERVETKCEISYPAASVSTDLPASATARAPPSVEVALVELFENAVVHHPTGEGPMSIAVTVDSDVVRIHVVDECEPIPEQVRETITQGVEQPLHHNDGLGLWIVRWVVDSVDGRLSFERRSDGNGNEVVLAFERVQR